MTALDTDVELIESLDFKFDQPCEHSQHTEAHDSTEHAAYFISVKCPHECGVAASYYVCASGLAVLLKVLIICRIDACSCGRSSPGHAWMQRIIPISAME